MKQYTKYLCFILALNNLFSICLNRSLNSSRAACSVSQISIPIGTNTPVMIYNARIEDENLKLTVLEKQHVDNYKVEGNLFYSDKKTGESWYASRNVDENNFEVMRDAFSLCRTLNNDNKETKIYQKSRLYSNYRTQQLPENLVLRVNNKNDEENYRKISTSFLQIKNEMEMTSSSYTSDSNEEEDDIENIVDSQMEQDLENLESDLLPDHTIEEYQNLNNDAYIENEQLQEEVRRGKKRKSRN